MPQGGFGNQVFIYAAGYAAASKQGCPLYIDKSWFHSQSLRNYELDTFSSVGMITRATNCNTHHKRSALGFSAGGVLSRLNLTKDKNFFEGNAFNYNPAFLKLTPGYTLHGFFQSYLYFESVQDDLRNQLRKIVEPSPWFLETQKFLANLGPWIAIHVRLGDYLSLGTREIHGVIPSHYYLAAANLMAKLLPGASFVIFSDDPPIAKSMLSSEFKAAHFLKSAPGSKSVETMVLMSQSHGSIIANSTFSWWGAWMGDREGRPVIAPRPWMNDPRYFERDLIPENWLTLGHRKTIIALTL
jgi:hypothetical protein